jgi:hypothetical protein
MMCLSALFLLLGICLFFFTVKMCALSIIYSDMNFAVGNELNINECTVHTQYGALNIKQGYVLFH